MIRVPSLPLRREPGSWIWPPAGLLALLCYVPLFLSRPGQLSGDTLDGLYLDPTRTFVDAASRWDPGISFGAVVDRTFGWTFPMSPFFWLADTVGIPMWVAQRLWMGSLLFVAALGVVALLRQMAWHGKGWLVAPVAYVCSPYVLSQLGVQSVTLLAFAGLPWIVALMMAALVADERHRWRVPARIGIVVALVMSGSISSFIGILPAPLLWVFYSVVATREVKWRHAARVLGRCTAASVAVSAWWLVGLASRPKAEVAFARQRDPIERVAAASLPSETIRSLGDWRFYTRTGRSALDAGLAYQRSGLVIALSFLTVIVAVLSFGRIRFFNRIYFVSLFALGVILSSGMSPDREAYSTILRSLTDTSVGAFLLPTGRCAPLVALSVAMAFAAAVRYAIEQVPDRVMVLTGAGCLVAMAGVPALFTGHALDGPLLASGDVPPGYWLRAAELIDAPEHDGFGVLEVPGLTVPEYTWGTTRQPVSTSLIQRTVALRTPDWPSQPATADLLAAIDDAGRSRALEPDAIAPLASLLGIDTILLRLDTPNDSEAARQWQRLLDDAVETGDLRSEPILADPDDPVLPGVSPQLPQLVIYTVQEPMKLVRLIDPRYGLVVSGSGAALPSLANQGLITGREAVQYSSTLDQAGFDRLPATVAFVVTDSNRYTEITGEIDDPVVAGGPVVFDSARIIRSDQSPPIAGVAESTWTTAVNVPEELTLTADRRNQDSSERPEYRAANAFDGDAVTLWAGRTATDGSGETVVASYGGSDPAAPAETSDETERPEPIAGRTFSGTELVVGQPDPSSGFDTVTRLRVGADGWSTAFELDDRSWTGGQRLVLEGVPASFGQLSVSIEQTVPGSAERPSVEHDGYAGLTEIRLVGDPVLDPERRDGPIERVKVPNDVLRFPELAEHPLAFLFERWDAVTDDGEAPEQAIHRQFELSEERTFDVTVTFGSDLRIPADCADRILSIDGAAHPLSFGEPNARQVIGTLRGVTLGRGTHVLDARVPVECGASIEVVLLNDVERPVAAAKGPFPADLAAFELDITSATSYQLSEVSVPRELWLTIGTSFDGDWTSGGFPGAEGARLLNGYSTSWLIPGPIDAPFIFTARWAPQRSISVAVIFSAIAFVVLMVLALIPAWRSPQVELVAPETLRAGNSNIVVLVVLGVFGIAAGAVPAIVAGAAALLLELRPQLQRRVAWTASLMMVVIAVAKVAHTDSFDPARPLESLAGPAWVEVLTYTALALSVTAALANTERPPIKRYPVEM